MASWKPQHRFHILSAEGGQGRNDTWRTDRWVLFVPAVSNITCFFPKLEYYILFGVGSIWSPSWTTRSSLSSRTQWTRSSYVFMYICLRMYLHFLLHCEYFSFWSGGVPENQVPQKNNPEHLTLFDRPNLTTALSNIASQCSSPLTGDLFLRQTNISRTVETRLPSKELSSHTLLLPLWCPRQMYPPAKHLHETWNRKRPWCGWHISAQNHQQPVPETHTPISINITLKTKQTLFINSE